MGLTLTGNSVTRRLSEMRAQLDFLNRQLGTGKKSTNYAGLGSQRTVSLNAHSRIQAIGSFGTTIETIDVRLQLAQTALSRFSALADEQRGDNLSSEYLPANGAQTPEQLLSKARLEEVLNLMNQDVNGRRLFSGRATDTNATLSVDEILNGSPPAAGLKDVIEERRRADTGSDDLGRLALTQPTASEVRLSDTTGVFGFKLAGVSSSFSNATVTDAAGPPRYFNVSFTGLPAQDEKIQLALTLPDGTSATISLKAVASNPGTNEFAIGATADDTAANLNAALSAKLQSEAKTSLRTASAFKAADDFFNISASQAPQRVNIVTTPEAATALRNATATDTVRWYQGDDATDDPRGTSTARVDTQLTLGYGMRATEAPFRQIVSTLAAFASVEFDPNDTESPQAYKELSTVTRNRLGTSSDIDIFSVQSQLANVQTAAKEAKERHTATIDIYRNIIDDVESVPTEEVASLILDLQTRLQASYQVTANLSQLSLVNFL